MRAKVVVRDSEDRIISQATGEHRSSIEFVLEDFKDHLKSIRLFNKQVQFYFTVELTEEDKPHFQS